MPPKEMGAQKIEVAGAVPAISTRTVDVLPTEPNPAFESNSLRTNQYSIFPWSIHFVLWKNLYQQFQRKANIYFLIVAILQLIPGLSPTGRFTTLATLVTVMAFSGIKSAYEDYQRYVNDTNINNRKTQCFDNGQWKEIPYSAVQVGMIVKVESAKDGFSNEFPCDMLFIESADPEGVCYVETSNLDGETNLKPKNTLSLTSKKAEQHQEGVPQPSNELCELVKGAKLEYEIPNRSIYTFQGNLTLPGSTNNISIGPNNVVLRGTQLRKIPWVVGVVLFTGHETKVMMNSRSPPFKSSRVEAAVNRYLIWILLTEVALCIISTIGAHVWSTDNSKDMWYLHEVYEPGLMTVLNFFTFIILYNNLIPISLYVSLELIRFLQGKLMEGDLCIYYAPKDMPMAARTTNINEELGQIKYVFSDKTGTLTCNIMKFMKFSVKGVVYGKGITEIGRAAGLRTGKQIVDERPPEIIALHQTTPTQFWDPLINDGKWESIVEHRDIIEELFVMLSVCHTVVTEMKGGVMKYEAESPDEAALVEAAKYFGFRFASRKSGGNLSYVTVDCGDAGEVTHEILHVFEFNSDRKRMSVVVRGKNKTVIVYCKGADTIMMKRMTEKDRSEFEPTVPLLKTFGDEGLRTLVLCKRVLQEEEYQVWLDKWLAVKKVISDKQQDDLDVLAAELETELTYIGVTAIEDKLQHLVPQTIEALRKANIKVWMLTGDKLETAINIGFACNMLSNDMKVKELRGTMIDTAKECLQTDLEGVTGAVVDGDFLGAIVGSPELRPLFYQLIRNCSSVVCCRVSPKQKADVVELVREFETSAVTLAIGDGANDVPMIQAGHVGVGISGMEGQQAANAADFAIGQFKYLHRLVLVHGLQNYYRVTKVICYFFYKNGLVVFCQFWYCVFNGFTGNSLFEPWSLAMYNVIFTFLPCILVGVADRQILNTNRIHELPEVYFETQQSEPFRVVIFLSWFFNAIAQSCGLTCILLTTAPLHMQQLDEIGTVAYTLVIGLGTMYFAMSIRSWTWIMHLFVWGSVLSWSLWLGLYGEVTVVSYFLHRIAFQVSSTLDWWLYMIVLVPMGLLANFIHFYANFYLKPWESVKKSNVIQLADSLHSDSSTTMPLERLP